LKVDITKLNPPQQVEVLISTFEKKGEDIISFVNGLERQYKTYQDFFGTRDHEAFKNEKLIELTLNALKRNDESTLPSLLNLLRIIARLGNLFSLPFSPFSFFFPTDESVFLFFFVDFSVVSGDNRIAIASKGGIELILQAMKRHPNHAGIQEYGCGVLFNLAANGELNLLFVFLFILLFFPTDESVFLFFFVDFSCLLQMTTELQLYPKEALN
jgi:hypothetical protein